MPQLPTVFALCFLFLGCSLGAVLRAHLGASVSLPFHYTSILQAHSHVLFFGWITIILGTLGASRDEFFSRRVAPAAAIASAAAFVSFLLWGYTAPSIFISAIFYLPWSYLVVRARGRFDPLSGGASAALVLAMVSTAFLPIIKMFGGPPDAKPLLISLFLHLLIDGWMTLSIVSLLRPAQTPKLASVILYLFATTLAALPSEDLIELSNSGRMLASVILVIWIQRSRHAVSGLLLSIAYGSIFVRLYVDAAALTGVFPMMREFIIGHIHLRTLTFGTCALLALSAKQWERKQTQIPDWLIAIGAIGIPAGLFLIGSSAIALSNPYPVFIVAKGLVVIASVLAALGSGLLFISAVRSLPR